MNWEQSKFFSFLQWLIGHFTKPMRNIWHTEFDGKPSIFVCNHDSAYGPIAMCVHFDLHKDLTPWINGQALSVRKMPGYVRTDYWWPRDKWYTKILDYTVAYIVAIILPFLIRGSACIPVLHDSGVVGTFRSSIDSLCSGKQVLLFPEKPIGYRAYAEKINTGWVSLGRMFHRRTGECLNFIPVYSDWVGKEIRIGAPIAYDPDMKGEEFTEKLASTIEAHFKCHGKIED